MFFTHFFVPLQLQISNETPEEQYHYGLFDTPTTVVDEAVGVHITYFSLFFFMKKCMLAGLLALLLCGCQTPQVAYFSDLQHGQTEVVSQVLDIRLRPEDKLSIVVKSMDPQLSELFNLAIVTQRVGYINSSSSNNSLMSVYTLDSKGEIDFPVLGQLKVGGMTRQEVARMIKDQLVSQDLVKDPVVTVEYANLGFNVLGEVNRPGRYTFDRDHLTLLDALSLAGDMTIQGERENVMVIREQEGKRISYVVNLKSGQELLNSPAFYLQQNDVVYVAPNSYRARQTTVNGNTIRSSSFWVSLASLGISVVLLIKNL